MTDSLPLETERVVKALSAAGRAEIEAALYPGITRWSAFFRECLYVIGGCAIACFAAGVAVFLTAVILNLIFHFSPS